MDKTLTLTYTAPGAEADAALDLFARYHGWPSLMAADGVTPLSKIDVARLAIRRLLIESIEAQAVRDAQDAAGAAARAAVGTTVGAATLILTDEAPA